ncbi:glycoside hydrolase family 75 protein [Prosthecochloris sp. GSB1]|uniref:glycoside hydrolase family 75 protein n=1 Tax=Prosthecochloris sp. GSB1 TaxID=281093 RepID=UPI001F219385|nr:glycoside hydrolase family 75 protein [Prosthecochloris sp. GSB1]
MKTTGTVFLIVLTLLVLAIPAQRTHAGVRKWKTYQKTQLFELVGSGAYFYVTGHMTIDADGAPDAYHPDNTGLDHLKHAGYPGTSWWKNVLVTDPKDPEKPYVVPDGPYQGYYLSMTSLRDMTKVPTDPSRYVDASRVPYLVFPSTFSRLKGVGALGDLGVAVNLDTGVYSPFIIADIGPEKHPLGEVSIQLAQRLGGGNVCPRVGPEKPLGEILYIVFPGSGDRFPWPGSEKHIDRIAEELLMSIGGTERVFVWIGRGSNLALSNSTNPDKT